MMYDFNKHLEQDEEILWTGQGRGGGNSKSIIGELIALAMMGFFFMFLLADSIVTVELAEPFDDIGIPGVFWNFGTLIPLVLLGLLMLLMVWSIVYKLFLKKKVVVNNFYCITNKRLLKYDAKKEELVCGYIVNYGLISCFNEADGHGDIQVQINARQQMGSDVDNLSDAIDLKNMIMHPNKENMPTMLFESVENPRELVKLIKKQNKHIKDEH